jgi:hypothetical protein
MTSYNKFQHPTNDQKFKPHPSHPAGGRCLGTEPVWRSDDHKLPAPDHPLCKVHGLGGCPKNAKPVAMHYDPAYYYEKDHQGPHTGPAWMYGYVPL